MYLALLGITCGAALAQTISSENPPTAAAEAPAQAAGCQPIGLTASGETVYPFQCKDFLGRQKKANSKSAARKPDAAEGKTGAKQQENAAPESSKPATEAVGTVPSLKREVRERIVGPAGCTHFHSYDRESGTYRTYGRQRRKCREVVSDAIPTKDEPPAFVPDSSKPPLQLDSPKAPPQLDSSKTPLQSADSTAAVDTNKTSPNGGDSRPAVEVDTGKIEADGAPATALTEHLTVATTAPPPDTKAINTDNSDPADMLARGHAEKTDSASANVTDHLVAVLLARPEITSISGLTGKTIAIDDSYSASNGNVRIAIVAAGASDIELSAGQTTALSRLINGEVPAAILGLVPAGAAERFPEIAGFNTLRIPLSPRS